MAELLSEEVKADLRPFVGHQLLNIITSGMYDDPLMVYREYVQNAVDSIDVAVHEGVLSEAQGTIAIQIDGDNRTICIEDNGAGLPYGLAAKVLLDLGCSPKDRTGQRGFRGIGRLGGLAYCDLLRFETRSSEDEDIAVVEWDRGRLDALFEEVKKKRGLIEVVKDITKVHKKKPTLTDRGHFFRVEMHNVRRFHSDKLMSVKTVRDYLSQVSPVPYDGTKFSHAEKVEEYFSDVAGYKNYRLTINGKSVVRPYTDEIQISSNVDDRIRDVKLFELPGVHKPLARGWYAIMDYRGSLPPSVAMRGIRVRQGNIEVGNEFFLSPLYLERRFATWTIGEIQVWDHNIRPNARRDGFEQTPEYESFLEQMSALGRFLSHSCRRSSGQRSRTQALARRLEEIESALANLTFFIDKEHQLNLIATARERLEGVRPLIDSSNDGQALTKKYQELQLRVDSLEGTNCFFHEWVDGRSIRHADKVDIIGRILKSLYQEYGKCRSVEDLMQRVLKPFSKSAVKKPLR